MTSAAAEGSPPVALAPREVLRARRARLLGRAPAGGLLFSGEAPPRNYAANTYPFRASSHVLFFAGVSIPGSALLLTAAEQVLYVPDAPPDDALWHGESPSHGALEEATGLAVRSLAALGARKDLNSLALLPAFDARVAAAQRSLTGRSPALGTLDDGDRAFALAVVDARLVHDAAAVAELRAAAEATVDAHRRGMAQTRVGASEWSIVAAMTGAFVERGFGCSYSPIVTTHGEVLHHHGHDGVLGAGDLLLADVGAESAGGFAGDVTRTWPVTGKFSATQRALYEVVLGAQRRAIALTNPGTRYLDLHLEAARAITEGLVSLGILRGDPAELVALGVHALFFPHGVGHLLGLDVHDMEDLGDLAGYAPGRTRSAQFGLSYLRLDRDLAPGMAVTIEPGFYQVPALLSHPAHRSTLGAHVRWEELAKFSDVRGIRIEDDVLVTASGPEVLTAGIAKEVSQLENRY